tara:strand:+ start:166 stop:699 length:534 start_codon:yes stop_codon:yes gene_type:complete
MLKKLVIFLLFLLAPVNSFSQNIKEDSLNCLTKNIYFEAKSQSIAGQLAVALVVMNRVKNSKFPSTICAVIYEGPHYESWKTKAIPGLPKKSRTYYPRRDRCQFSWYCDGKSDNPSEQSAVDKAQRIAWLVMNGHVFDFTNGSLYYHADYVNPKWAKNKIKIVQIDNHIFYGEVYDR